MDDRQWMYNGWASAGRVTREWITNAQAFLDEAFSKVKGTKDSKTTWCPCSCCGNSCHLTKMDMASHLYYRWPFSTRPMGQPIARFFGPTRARAQHDFFGPGPARAQRWAGLGFILSA
jgi:hypothetical protein